MQNDGLFVCFENMKICRFQRASLNKGQIITALPLLNQAIIQNIVVYKFYYFLFVLISFFFERIYQIRWSKSVVIHFLIQINLGWNIFGLQNTVK